MPQRGKHQPATGILVRSAAARPAGRLRQRRGHHRFEVIEWRHRRGWGKPQRQHLDHVGDDIKRQPSADMKASPMTFAVPPGKICSVPPPAMSATARTAGRWRYARGCRRHWASCSARSSGQRRIAGLRRALRLRPAGCRGCRGFQSLGPIATASPAKATNCNEYRCRKPGLRPSTSGARA